LNPYSHISRQEFVKISGQLARMRQLEVFNMERILRSDVQKWSRKL
jgi:hypothetical protein